MYNSTTCYAKFAVAVLFYSTAAFAAEPYVTPPELSSCGLPDVNIPNESDSTYYGSDECGVIFIPPPERLIAEVVAQFSDVRKEDCAAILTIKDAIQRINVEKAKLSVQRVTERFRKKSTKNASQ